MIFENWLNCEPVSVFCVGAAAVGGPAASESFIPPGFNPRFAASPPMPGRGLIIRGLCAFAIGAELKVGAPGLFIPGGNLILASPPAIAPLGVVGVLFCGIPPTNGPLPVEA
jgi:hypothetical protein